MKQTFFFIQTIKGLHLFREIDKNTSCIAINRLHICGEHWDERVYTFV